MKRIVSVITTIYNAEKYIGTSANSVFGQEITDKNLTLEYIVVNDHTKDNSMIVFENYVQLYKQTHNNKLPKNFKYKIVKPEHNLGCGGARKFGIENASGKYLMFLDADDYYINSDFVQRAVETIESTNSDIVEYGLYYNYADGRRTPSVIDKQVTIENNPAHALVSLYKNNLIKFHVWTKIIRKEIAKKFEYSTQRTFEDVITIPVWISMCKRITIMPSIEINYRCANNSIIHENVLDTRLGTLSAIAANFERFKEWRPVLMAMYERAMIDLSVVLDGKTSEDPGFNKMSELNTKMLSYILPEQYKSLTFNLKEDN